MVQWSQNLLESLTAKISLQVPLLQRCIFFQFNLALKARSTLRSDQVAQGFIQPGLEDLGKWTMKLLLAFKKKLPML